MLEATIAKCRKDLSNKLKEYEVLDQVGLLTNKQANRRKTILDYLKEINNCNNNIILNKELI